ncbi:MAG: iron-containing alcohol dehydrogenase [Spirochaetia bacterium]|nr:iron-containing alcohol dehydrogenase [Spirochaetia bacterium]
MADKIYYHFPTKIHLERDSIHKIGDFVKQYGDRVLLISVQTDNTNQEGINLIQSSLERVNCGCVIYDDIHVKPGIKEIDTAVHFARQSRANLILAYGSRDSFYTARIVSSLMTNDVFTEDISFDTFPLREDPLPIVTVPTGPCMGEEVSPMVSIYDSQMDFFFQKYDERLFSKLAFIDPHLSESMTDSEIASSSIATVASAVESVLSRNSNDITSGNGIHSVELVFKNLVSLVNEGGGPVASYNISLASLMSGMSHSVTELGASFSIASAISYVTSINFYMAISIILPHVMEYNLTSSAGKFVNIAKAMDENIHEMTVIEAAIKSIEGIRKMSLELKMPQRLSEFNMEKTVIPDVAKLAVRSPFINNAPREIDAREVEAILTASY